LADLHQACKSPPKPHSGPERGERGEQALEGGEVLQRQALRRIGGDELGLRGAQEQARDLAGKACALQHFTI